MLRLYVLRHAKTAWALPGQRDFDRMLNERGMADLNIIGAWVSDFAIAPAHVYCSPAARTRGTLEGIADAFDVRPRAEHPDELYSGTVRDYLAILRAHPRAEALMVVGHNPSCAGLAHCLAGTGERAQVRVMAAKYPTGAMAVIDFERASWREIGQGDGHLARFLIPGDFRAKAP